MLASSYYFNILLMIPDGQEDLLLFNILILRTTSSFVINGAREQHERVVGYPLTKGIQHSVIFILILQCLSLADISILVSPVISLLSFLICFVTLKVLLSYLIPTNFSYLTLLLALCTIKI